MEDNTILKTIYFLSESDNHLNDTGKRMVIDDINENQEHDFALLPTATIMSGKFVNQPASLKTLLKEHIDSCLVISIPKEECFITLLPTDYDTVINTLTKYPNETSWSAIVNHMLQK